MPGRLGNIGRSLGRGGASGKTDSLKHRSKTEDSITINFRYIDSARNYKLDSSVSDFTKLFPIPADYYTLGNDGSAAKSFLFSPLMKAGWDPGFHAYDIYKLKMENVHFFNTTRPYAQLNYLLGSKAEQFIEALITRNINPGWNASFNYRVVSSPGFFKNQKTNHNTYLFTSWYQSKAKRYNNYFVLLANSLKGSENGGFRSPSDLENPDNKDRFQIDTWLGGDQTYSANSFKTNIVTGNQYNELSFLMRQQYDFGRKDSLVTDSTVIPLFYPRVRFEHTFSYNTYKYEFHDYYTGGINRPDSNYYINFYDYNTHTEDSVRFRDTWREIFNDFSIYQFPDANNLQQFIKIGASMQNLNGRFATGTRSLYNFIAHAEYRNRTRDRKWDMEANGKLYLTGFNAGDYQAHISLQRLIGKKLGYLQLGFENVNRSPSFIYNPSSSFYFDTTAKNFNKENTLRFFASYYNPALKLTLTGNYYLISNYMYLAGYYKLKQESSIFNFLQVALHKTFKVGRHWFWYTDIYAQQKAGDVDLNVPLIFTRNRLALEGVFYKNLNIATGIEVRYNTAYKADSYSPVLGQFMYQDTLTIKNRPDIRLYLNFRIRSFKLFISASNLNSVSFSNGFGFTDNNIPAPGYAYPGFQLRFGIYWNFVN
ncbi:MAG: hypothetical protein JST09_10605 [Bacteroidetes bacterium]|nr:hypothetical protein [Bacteroidota bacterium]